MLVDKHEGSKVIDMAAYRAARTASGARVEGMMSETPWSAYCDAADGAAWYHYSAVSEDRKR